MTRARATRASWSAAAVVSPVVAALAAGSILWAAGNNPLATAGEAPAVPAVAAAQVASPAVATEPLSLDQLRKKSKKLARAVDKARKEARAARESGAVIASGGSTWVPSTPSTSGGSNAQAAPAPAPAPAPAADTWTGSSGG